MSAAPGRRDERERLAARAEDRLIDQRDQLRKELEWVSEVNKALNERFTALVTLSAECDAKRARLEEALRKIVALGNGDPWNAGAARLARRALEERSDRGL